MMATVTMGPPLSPLAREPRRSGRRPATLFNAIASPTSRSPDPQPLSPTVPRMKEPLQRSASNGSNRSKRTKQEDVDDILEDHPFKNGTNGTINGATNGRAKRKGKEKELEKDKMLVVDINVDEAKSADNDQNAPAPSQDLEDNSVTRCICGDDDPEMGGEFMVQCETCNVWQHGLCMGYENEEELQGIGVDYYCEQCRPDLHEALLKRLAKKMRHASNTSHHNSISATSNPRSSRSHSPSHLLQKPAKRRNTMNSRDAAYDESLQEVIEQSAAEAAAAEAAAHATVVSTVSSEGKNGESNHVEGEDEGDAGIGSAKKRKRTDDDAASIKKQRSPSTVSDRAALTIAVCEETPFNSSSVVRSNSGPTTAPKVAAGRNKRGGRKNAQAADLLSVAGDEEPTAPKRHTNNRTKSGQGGTKRGAPASQASGSTDHRRGNTNSAAGHAGTHPNARGSTSAAAAARAYHQSHEYAVSQQTLYTSWHLPDYLSHLEPMLPSKEPIPLRVQSSGLHGLQSLSVSLSINGNERDCVAPDGVTIERGVKIKWPAKRMSVGDMNKRVRALLEWVGREQASAGDRMRRREALEKALREVHGQVLSESSTRDEQMLLDGETSVPDSPLQDKLEAAAILTKSLESRYSTQSTIKLMEELTEELINFQEKFGPGAKTKERERRAAAGS
ncbi:hypothetical protein NEOLEDRAFT_1128469 [Neolentinus lepideus HHB14362 ss-1]|uniref:Zinc finger PHD-type domain-containing protein n=1 Tax=Neolentinus lepideus HHB14362 ss-1 TaxID=1314782 RepID=A0A165V0M3_9AGAM|nr:hypothetical protein NEOLEDRAFT_1128469 [Neolentinus lepideus HHB14362 ss-1]